MRQIINFNSKWAFSKLATEIPKDIDNKWDFVNLPHSWNAIDGQDGDNDYFRGTAYYAKKFNKTDLPGKSKEELLSQLQSRFSSGCLALKTGK